MHCDTPNKHLNLICEWDRRPVQFDNRTLIEGGILGTSLSIVCKNNKCTHLDSKMSLRFIGAPNSWVAVPETQC